MIYFLFYLPILVISEYNYYVTFGEVKTLFQVTDAIDAQLVQIDEDNTVIKDQQYCFILDQSLQLDGTLYIIPNYLENEEQDITNKIFQNILLDLVFIDDIDVYAITSNNNLFHVSLQNNFTNLHNLVIEDYNDFQLPQLIGSSQLLLLIYIQKAYKIDIRNNYQTESIQQWSNTQQRYFTNILDNIIFSAIGENGLEIYLINFQYQLYKITTETIGVQMIDFRDFSIQKLNEKKYVIYILCKKNGVIVIEMTSIRDSISFKLLLKFIGPKTDGIAIDLYDEDHIFVAYKSNHQYYIIQYKIEAFNKKWGSISRHNILNRIIDIDANSNYLLVQGFYRHTMIYYQEKQKPIQFILNSVKQFILNDKIIMGVASDFIFSFSTSINPYQIKCFIDSDSKQFEQKYKLMYRTNTTWRQQEFKVIFNQEQFNLTFSFIFIIIVLFTIFILIILTYLQCKSQKQQFVELNELEQKLKQLPQNRASKLLMPYTFRLTQQSVEHRINTLNYAEDTMLHKDVKY